METDQQSKLKQVKLVLFFNLLMAIYALTVVIRSFAKGETWRIAFASAGFCFFLLLIVMLTIRLKKLQKTQNA